MSLKKREEKLDEDSKKSRRQLKYVVIACAVLEFIGFVVMFYYKLHR